MKRVITAALVAIFAVIAAQGHLLYKVSGGGLERPSYIFGTHHFATLSILDSIPSVMKSLEEVERVCGEIDMLSDSQLALAMKMQPYMTAPADSTIDRLLPPEQLADLAGKFEAKTGMKLEMMYPLRPIVPQTIILALDAQRLTGRSMTDPQLDTYLQEQGKKLGKSNAGLETVEQQAEILYCGKPISSQLDDLIEMLNTDEDQAALLAELTDAYMTQDLERMTVLSDKELKDADDVAYMKRLLQRRNADWLSKMPAMMAGSPTLFVVGALHLPGGDGILEGLRKSGFTVTPIAK